MFYRVIIVSCLLGGLTSSGFASPALHLVRDLNIKLVEAKLPYVKKIAKDRLNAEQLKKFDAVTHIYGEISYDIDVYREMEAIKMLSDKEASELNTFAAKFFAAVEKNAHENDMTCITLL